MTAKSLLKIALFFLASTGQAQRLHSGEHDLSILGYGVDQMEQELRLPCLTGEYQFHRNEMLELRVYQSASLDEYFHQQSGSGSIGADIWLVGAKAKHEFLNRNTETDRRMSMIWELVYEFGTQSLEDRSLSLIGADAVNRPANEKQQLCGERFVHSAKIGAKVFLAASLHFPSKESYQRFKTIVTVSILGGLIKFSKEFLKEMEKHGAEAHLSIQALQLGGNHENLTEISSQGQQFCPIHELERCLDQFQRLYTYMFDPHGFRQSMIGLDLNQLYPIYFTTELYRESDHEDLSTQQ